MGESPHRYRNETNRQLEQPNSSFLPLLPVFPGRGCGTERCSTGLAGHRVPPRASLTFQPTEQRSHRAPQQTTRISDRTWMLPSGLTQHHEQHRMNTLTYGGDESYNSTLTIQTLQVPSHQSNAEILSRHELCWSPWPPCQQLSQLCIQIPLLSNDIFSPPLAGSVGDEEVFENSNSPAASIYLNKISTSASKAVTRQLWR